MNTNDLRRIVENLGGKIAVDHDNLTVFMPATTQQTRQCLDGDQYKFFDSTPIEEKCDKAIEAIEKWKKYWSLMSEIRKADIKTYIRKKLADDPKWTLKALLKIYELQTTDEQNSLHTIHHNNVGFTGHDAVLMTSFVNQLKQRDFLSKKQMDIVKKVIPKYWKQIYEMSDKVKLLEKVKAAFPAHQMELSL